MKKKILILVAIVLAFILFCPIPSYLKDGGTVEYRAILYSVWDVHRLALDEKTGYEEGLIVEILGIEVFNNVDR